MSRLESFTARYPMCLNCQSKEHVWRNGRRKGIQRFHCGACGNEVPSGDHLKNSIDWNEATMEFLLKKSTLSILSDDLNRSESTIGERIIETAKNAPQVFDVAKKEG